MIKKTGIINRKEIVQPVLGLLIIGISFLFDGLIINIVNAIQYPFLFEFFYIITLFGETYIFIWIALMLIAALMIFRRPITAFILTLAASGVTELLLKIVVNRPRPFQATNIVGAVTTNMSSFPSGHAMMFFTIIPILSKNFPKMKMIVWIMAVLVGISRIYLGVHYFSDVIAGAILGYGIGWICMKIGEKYAWKY